MKAVGLFSGGLDSIIACHLILDQNIQVICLHINAPFIVSEINAVEKSFRTLRDRGAELVVEELSSDFLNILMAPKHGYGSQMNPCIDCHIYMLRAGKNLMVEIGAEFVFTGDVLGERPMSQSKGALDVIEKESGLEGMLLRPLSAKLLKPTEVEIDGRVDRDRLLDIKGRSRSRQLELAEVYGLEFIPSPAGGCLLTDVAYARKVEEAMEHKELSLELLHLFRYGRHFRLPSGSRLIVGRNESENKVLEGFSGDEYILLEPKNDMGPTCLLIGDDDIELASSIMARYCDGEGDVRVRVNRGGLELELLAKRLEDSRVRELMVK